MPIARTVIRSGQYRDSIELMRITLEIEALDGVQQASVMMGTPANKQLLADAGLLGDEADRAGPNDLMIALRAESDVALAAAEAGIEELLRPADTCAPSSAARRPRSMAQALERTPGATLALISTPGPYAAAEALKALRNGLHVFLFSDNVAIEDEVALKRMADAHDLLVMGPDCGTAILGGVALGFANVVRSGSIGLVGPSGTGIQQVTCLIDRLGGGVSHAIGTGSHDLSTAVGGITARRALQALDADPSTHVILLVAKPCGPAEAQELIDFVQSLDTPAVINVLGLNPNHVTAGRTKLAATLEETAELAVALDRGAPSSAPDEARSDLAATAAQLRSMLVPGQRFVRGLFSGGTLCAEAALLLAEHGLEVQTNVNTPGCQPIQNLSVSSGHTLIDLGADELTVSRPHPMIDFRARLDRLAQEARDPSVAVIFLDVVLGHGAHPDPAADLAPAIEQAHAEARGAGRALAMVGSVCGTARDPQGFAAQEARLRQAGLVLLSSNAAAARVAAMVVGATGAKSGLGPAASEVIIGGGSLSPAPYGSDRLASVASRARDLLGGSLSVINVGLEEFAERLTRQGVEAMHVPWRPPGQGDPRIAGALAQLTGDKHDSNAPGSLIDRANEEAMSILLTAQPKLTGLVKAYEVWPNMTRRLLHAGPPIAWNQMCGPMRGAIVGAALFEGWAADETDARELLDRGEIELAPCHQFDAVGPMAGVISPNMSVWVVRNVARGNLAYSNLNEGLGRVLRYGAYSPDVIERLRWMENVLAPVLRKALATFDGGLDIKAILAQALQMGDDGHNRNLAGTSLLYRQLSLAILETESEAARAREVLTFIDANNHFFLNLSMAAAKAMLEAAHGITHSSLVTTMARNGVEFGIRVSGLGNQWFTAPAPTPNGLYFPGYSEVDANPDMGDSAITETAGWGGFAMAAAPAMVQFVGGTAADAVAYTHEMMEITLARNGGLALPALGFGGTPTGIDIRRVLDSGIQPIVNTGIAHKDPGIGQVGAGIVRAPMACFESAILALLDT